MVEKEREAGEIDISGIRLCAITEVIPGIFKTRNHLLELITVRYLTCELINVHDCILVVITQRGIQQWKPAIRLRSSCESSKAKKQSETFEA